jgi:hypothetical protein
VLNEKQAGALASFFLDIAINERGYDFAVTNHHSLDRQRLY